MPRLPATWHDNIPPGIEITYPQGTYYDDAAIITLRASSVSFDALVPSGRVSYSTRVEQLHAWAELKGLTLIATHTFFPTLTVAGSRIRVRIPFHDSWIVAVAPGGPYVTGREPWTPPPTFTCPDCSRTHPGGTLVCPQTGKPIACPQCHTYPERTEVTSDPVSLTAIVVCRSCGQRCDADGCDRLVVTRYRNSASRVFCPDHGSVVGCHGCGVVMAWQHGEDGPMAMRGGGWVCEECERGVCQSCQVFFGPDELVDVEDQLVCQRCARSSMTNFREEVEESDMDAVPRRDLVRLCGVEIEGANGEWNGSSLAYELYRAKLSGASEMLGYHSGEAGFAKVEHDSSVDWELIMGPMNMADPDDVDKFNRAVSLLHDAVKDGRLKLDLRAGLHVHVSAERVGLPQAYNLSHLFTYVEDPLYRIGAARWPMHRASLGNRATRSIPKFNRKLEFLSMQGGDGGGHDDHYYALSFGNYFRAMSRYCRCGAVQNGFWDECTCTVLPKCTFEFRLFNTTANRRKLHAYLGVCQALVQHALEIPEIRRPAEEYPGLPYERAPLKTLSGDRRDTLIAEWKPRLHFLLWTLPLTDTERDALVYCIRHSDIARYTSPDKLEALLSKEVTA